VLRVFSLKLGHPLFNQSVNLPKAIFDASDLFLWVRHIYALFLALRHSVVRDAFALLTCGRPNLDPLRRALCKPARMRSDRRKFSCLAMVAIMDITASLKTPVESKYCSV
jgi:hypothetical protein